MSVTNLPIVNEQPVRQLVIALCHSATEAYFTVNQLPVTNIIVIQCHSNVYIDASVPQLYVTVIK